jgi:hypothetical protein
MHAYTVKIKTADTTQERAVYASGLREAAEIGQAHGLVVGVRRSRTIALVSCVKTKQAEARPFPARELYTSPLFTGMREYAAARTDDWFILSAEHGLVAPDTPLLPYDAYLGNMKVRERKAWAADVLRQLDSQLRPGDEIMVLAGRQYREHIVPELMKRGHRITVPMQGLGLFKQLEFLKSQNAASI